MIELSEPVLAAGVFTMVAVGAVADRVLTQYILPASSEQTELAERLQVQRRHLESLRSWEARTRAAGGASP
jgi:hypothetical protein